MLFLDNVRAIECMLDLSCFSQCCQFENLVSVFVATVMCDTDMTEISFLFAG